MPDIRYVCLSDLHFGEESSLLTNLEDNTGIIDPTTPSPVMTQLVECLRHLISKNEDKTKKPTLILNGDALEMALANVNQAAMVFENFIDLAMLEGKEIFDKKVIIIPGNHDHHIWEVARETQYVDFISGLEPGNRLHTPWHTTNMFDPTPVTAYLLTRLIRRSTHLKDMVINAAYPNYALLDKDKGKCVIFHHGHFTESIYQLMSTLKNLIFPDRLKPKYIWDLEAENFAWIDFFWSMLGRSGEVGEQVESVYERLHYPEKLERPISDLADSLAKNYDLPGPGDRIEAKILTMILNPIVNRAAGMERNQLDEPLSSDTKKGLENYITGPLREQIKTELGEYLPDHINFVFGHTHKPFQEIINFEGFPEPVNVYNTGGWVVDKIEPQPLHGGAAVLIDEELNLASLRMYNEAKESKKYSVEVGHVDQPEETDNTFAHRILSMVNSDDTPWRDFSEAVNKSVSTRMKLLKRKLDAMN